MKNSIKMKLICIFYLFVAFAIVSCERNKAEHKENPCEINDSTFTDIRDGSVYKIVKIGNQIWMAENLRYLPSVNIPTTISDSESLYYVYGYNGVNTNEAKKNSNYLKYGVIYNWQAAQTACPDCWRLAYDIEWVEFNNYDSAGYLMKSKQGWYGNGSGNDSLKFNALPGGFLLAKDESLMIPESRFAGIDSVTFWWAHYEHDTTRPYNIYLRWNSPYLDINVYPHQRGFYIRCIKDDAPLIF
ncbi:MAG: hypothetical protein EHM20_17580 [Alphaproteobacteria bacterium]|nr:MAG: hypothetical protein EHM20_17580 [Alphaproteobacteria bacterium]